MNKAELVLRQIMDDIVNSLTKQEEIMLDRSVDIQEILQFTECKLKQYKLFPNIPNKIPKNNEESLKYYYEGFIYDKQNKVNEALESYNKAIAFAETGSITLRLAYFARSVIFDHLELYTECLHGLNMAIELLPFRHSNEAYELYICKEYYQNIIFNNISSPCSECQEDVDRLTRLCYPKHSQIPFIANCIELTSSPDGKQSVKTNQDLRCGDVIAIERPFAWTLNTECIYRYCTYCLKETFSLIPCPSCTLAMFCNQECMKKAYENFHKYECQIINYLFEIIFDHRLLSIRAILQTISIFKDIDLLIDFEKRKTDDTNPFTTNFSDTANDDEQYDKDKEIQKLNYYLMHAYRRDLTDLSDLHYTQYLSRAVEVILITNQLFETLKDFLKTDEHKHFIRKFLYCQFEISEMCWKDVYYRGDSSSDSNIISYGSGIYTFSGLMNHSCTPNILRIYNNGSVATIIVSRPIKHGEELFNCYSDC